jgi:hypothetical protein
MGWTDFYRRREILEAAVRQAKRAPQAPLELAEIPGAAEEFGTEDKLLTALQYKWTQLLSGYLRAEFADPDDAGFAGDRVDAVTRAWHHAQRDHEDLRAVLDGALGRCAALEPLHRTELHLLALTSGLAEPHEPADEIVKVGQTLDALLRAGDSCPVRRRGPMGQLLRLLAPSA